MSFDPDAASAPGSGIFGLDHDVARAAYVVLGVPFDATTSYRDGTRNAPAAVLLASHQVDLYDVDFGRAWRRGIAMLPLESGPSAKIARINERARRLARPIIEVAGQVVGRPKLENALRVVNRLTAEVDELVGATVAELLERGKRVVLLGGDHSTPLGSIRAHAARHPGLGILHVDAHADLREAYEGFHHSHASIMYNVVRGIGRSGGVARLVQVGVRDVGEREVAEIRRRKARSDVAITTYFDADLKRARMQGVRFTRLCDRIVADLPRDVYLSVDIDGLDPTLCPDTGTPVPGGLAFSELVELLRAVVRGKRRIVGLDLCEVAPNPRTPRDEWGGDWNAAVGARVLYKMIGATARVR